MNTRTHDRLATLAHCCIWGAMTFLMVVMVLAALTGCESNAPAKTVVVTIDDLRPHLPDEWETWWDEHRKECKQCGGPPIEPMCMTAWAKFQEITRNARGSNGEQVIHSPPKQKATLPCGCTIATATGEIEPIPEATTAAEGTAPVSQPVEVAESSPAGHAEHNPKCTCLDCKCGESCACGVTYTAGGYSYRVKAGRVEVFVQRCINGQCSGEWTDWYSLPNNQRAAIRGGETRKAAAGCASGNCGVGLWQPRRIFRRGR